MTPYPPTEPEPEQEPGLGAPPEYAEPTVDYNVGLSADELQALGQRVKREIEAYEQAVSDRRSLCQQWRDDCELVEADVNQPWDNAAAVRVPFTAMAVDYHVGRLNEQVTAPNPPFAVNAGEAEAQEYVPVIEDVLPAKLEECGWKAPARGNHAELVATGNTLLCATWERETRRVPRHVRNLDTDVFEAVVEANVNPVDAFQYASDPGWSLVFEEEVVRDGPVLSVVPFERVFMLPPNAHSAEDCWAFGEETLIRGLDLKLGAKKGTYLEEPVRELLERGAATNTQSELEATRDYHSGVDTAGYEPVDPKYRDFRCAELAWWDDLNEDGECEWYWLTVELETGKVLRCQYSPYEHGQAWYTPFTYYPREGYLFGAGLPERIAGLQDAGTAIYCDLLNMQDQATGDANNFAYDLRSGLDPSRVTRGPGVPLFVPGNVDGLLPIPVTPPGPAMAQGMALLQLTKDWIELLTGASNVSLGKETDTDKTLGEVRLAAGNANRATEDNAAGVLLAWAKVWDQVRWLISQYGEGGQVKYRAVAKPGTQARVWLTDPMNPGLPVSQPIPEGQEYAFGNVPAEVLRAKVDLEPTGLSSLPDPAARLQRDMLVFNLTGQVLGSIMAPGADALLEVYRQTLQDARFPGADRIYQQVQQARVQAMTATVMAGIVGGAQQGAEQAEMERQGAEQGAREQEAHGLAMEQGRQGLVQGDMAMSQPPAKNGKAKK